MSRSISQYSGHANGAAARKCYVGGASCTANRQVVVIESRNGLRTGAVEINCDAGNRESVSARSKAPRDADRPAAGQCARPAGAAGQTVVVESRNALGPRAIEIDRA